MRYTTLIDIREVPEIYRNINSRLVYLHLVLVAGYHDGDRDQVTVSVRGLAAQTGLSVSAVRNALKQLAKHGLLQRSGAGLMVTKYVLSETPTKRGRTRQEQALQDAAAERKRKESEDEERQRAEKAEKKKRQEEVTAYVRTASLADLHKWRDEIAETLAANKGGRPVYSGKHWLPATNDAVKWLENCIAFRTKK